MAIDINNLTADDIAQLRGVLGIKEEGLRSPVRGPLKDLREPQNPKDRLHRPNFFWSADAPPDAPYIGPFPRLLFRVSDGHVEERKVQTPAQYEQLLEQGWDDAPPLTIPPAQVGPTLSEMLEGLSDAEKAAIMAAHQEDRVTAIRAQLMTLAPEEVARLLGTVSGETASAAPRRGRPRKVAADGDGA